LLVTSVSLVGVSAPAQATSSAVQSRPVPPQRRLRAVVDRADVRAPGAARSVRPAAAVPTGSWKPLGPAAIGPSYLMAGGFYGGVNSGRITALVAIGSGSHAGRIVAGSAGGGVWTSDDNGATWAPRSDQQSNLAIGSLAEAATNPDVLIAGTGEGNQCGDCYAGSGVLISSDGGTTWSVQDPGGVFDGRHVSAVAIDPTSASRMFAATDGGLFVTTNGGTSWSLPTDPSYASVNGNINAVVIDPSNASIVYIAGGAATVAKSTDGGVHWAAANTGIAAPGTFPLIALALAPSTPTTLYVSIGSTNHAVALSKTTNSGGSWSPVTVPDYTGQSYSYGSGAAEQGWYDNVVAIDPTNASHVIAGGIALVATTNGGTTWSNVNGKAFFAAGTNLLHPDQHALAFRSDGNVWIGDDGGVFLYNPAGPTVTNSNGNLNITQLYYGFNEVGGTLLAGAQDNASMRTSSASESAWTGILSGDGGPSAITPNHSSTQFIEANQRLYLTTDGFVSDLSDITPPALGLFTPPMTVVANTVDATNPTVFYGGPNLYRSTNPAAASPTWTKVTTVGAYVSAIAVSPSNPQVVYVGFTNGTIQVSTDGGVTFSSLAAQPFSQTFVTGLSVDPTNPNAITASVSYNDTRYLAGLPHVAQYSYSTTPASGAWTVVTGNLPSVAVSRVVYAGGALIAATDAGVYGTGTVAGGSTSWSLVGTGLPRVQVQDLYVDPTTSAIYAVTHGRGAWRFTPSKAPAGYTVVSSGGITVAPGTQTHGEVSCPTPTKPVSGGVSTPSADLGVNMSSSYPKGPRNWAVNMNNASGTATSMYVYAVCIKRPAAQFTVNTAPFTAPANSQVVGVVPCPSGVVVGGGVRSSSTSTAVNIASIEPTNTTQWEAWINNATASNTSFTVWAICRNNQPAGYSRQMGAVVANPAGQDTYANATCPGAKVPLSGGIYSDGSGLHQNVNMSAPGGRDWLGYFNNGDAFDDNIFAVAICAGT
jgi:hypothetical protein